MSHGIQQMDPQQLTAKDALQALDLPWSDDLAQSTASLDASDIWRHTSRFLSSSVARDVWVKWNPEQSRRIEEPLILHHFSQFLANGLELGYRLYRFREVSSRLPNPDEGARNWISHFEDAVGGDDCCTVRLFLSREQYRAFWATNPPSPENGATWEQMLSRKSDELFYQLGLVLRPITVAVDDTLAPPWFRCEWNDLRLPPRRGVDAQSLLVNDTVDRLTPLKVKGERATNPEDGTECAVVDKSHQSTLKEAGLTTWDSQEHSVLAVGAAVRQAAAALVNRSLYRLYLLGLQELRPDLVSVVKDCLDSDFVVQILRGLLAEGISVRDLSTVLEAALELRSTISVDMNKYIVFSPLTGGVYPDSQRRAVSGLLPGDYVEFIRARLRRYISHKYTGGGNTLLVYLMDRTSEELLAKPNNLDAAAEAVILRAVREEIATLPPTALTPVILTTLEVRRRLRRLVSLEFPHLAVLSYQELSPDMNIQPIARITPDW